MKKKYGMSNRESACGTHALIIPSVMSVYLFLQIYYYYFYFYFFDTSVRNPIALEGEERRNEDYYCDLVFFNGACVLLLYFFLVDLLILNMHGQKRGLAIVILLCFPFMEVGMIYMIPFSSFFFFALLFSICHLSSELVGGSLYFR